jgi:hypothetical protein
VERSHSARAATGASEFVPALAAAERAKTEAFEAVRPAAEQKMAVAREWVELAREVEVERRAQEAVEEQREREGPGPRPSRSRNARRRGRPSGRKAVTGAWSGRGLFPSGGNRAGQALGCAGHAHARVRPADLIVNREEGPK